MCNEQRASFIGWLLREVLQPLVCFVCLYVGVLCSAALPVAVLASLTPEAATHSLTMTPVAAFALAVGVFRRSWQRWQRAAQTPLGARMLGALGDGVQWMRGGR